MSRRTRTRSMLFGAACSATCLAAAMSHSASGATPHIHGYQRTATIQIPGDPLTSFDISYVDAARHHFYLADRTHAGIDVIDTRRNKFLRTIGGFVGAPVGIADAGGPNGVAIVNSREIWAGDGPSAALGGESSVRVFDQESLQTTVIPTGGVKRTDEVAWDPDDRLFMAVNNADDPPFVSLISTRRTKRNVVAKIEFPHATNGLEQPVWDSATKKFYLSVPELDGSVETGAVAQIDPRTKAVVLFPVAGCEPAGLALGPNQELLIGCSKDALAKGAPPQSIIISALDGHIVASIPQVAGSDEVWYNKGDDHYYLAASGNPGGPVLGVIDATTHKSIQNVPTSLRSHSVAADYRTNKIFVPLGPDPLDAQCLNGCIGVYAKK